MTINDILQKNVNINNLSREEYVRIIEEISHRYRSLLYDIQLIRNSSDIERSENAKIVKKLESDIENLNKINTNLMNIFDRDLTIGERLTGRVDIKKSIQKR